MAKFMRYIANLKDVKPVSIEPHVEKLTADQQRTLKEEQDLGTGAVRIGVIQQSSAASSGRQPQNGDLVVFHYTVREGGFSKVLASTESQHGGSGCPHAAVIFKANRIPRGWELGLADLQEGQRAVIITSAAYGFDHADCGMPRPAGVPPHKELHTEVHLLKVLPAEQVTPSAVDPTVIKVLQRRGLSWETPRVPYEVSFECCVTELLRAGASADLRPMTAVLGSGQLPPGLETALSSMNASEESMFVMPSALLCGGSDVTISAPAHVPLAAVHIKLTGFVEVRDMTGDGQVVKRKVKAGRGSFPVDAPMNDATVTVHYSAHVRAPDGSFGAAVVDTRPSEPLRFTTGEGNMPEGMEMALRLMLPGESSQVTCAPRFGYDSCSGAAPPGVPPGATVRFDIDLVDFEKEGHPQVMTADEIIAWATRQKDAANKLYKMSRTDFAIKKYEKTLRSLEAFRECETDEQFEAVTRLKLAMLSNLAAAHIETHEYMEAVRKCDAVLGMDPGNVKVLLRKAKALSLNGDYQACRDCCAEVSTLGQVSEAEVDDLRALNDRREKEAERKQKSQFANFFGRA